MIVGGVLSTFVTVKLHVFVLLLASLAVSVTVMPPVPFTGVPGAGDCVIVVGLHPSLAVAPDI